MITIFIGDNNNLGLEVPLEDIPANVSDVKTLLMQKIGGTPIRKCVACQCPQVGVIRCQKDETEILLLVDRALLRDPQKACEGAALFVYRGKENTYSVIFEVKPAGQTSPVAGTAKIAGKAFGAAVSPGLVGSIGVVGASLVALPAAILGAPSLPGLIVVAASGIGLALAGKNIADAVKTGRQIKAWKTARQGKAADVADVVGIGTLVAGQQQIAVFGNHISEKQRPEWGWGTFAITEEMKDYFFFVSGRLSKTSVMALAQFSRYIHPNDIVVHNLDRGQIYQISQGGVHTHRVITTKYDVVYYEPDMDLESTPENQDTAQAQQLTEEASAVS